MSKLLAVWQNILLFLKITYCLSKYLTVCQNNLLCCMVTYCLHGNLLVAALTCHSLNCLIIKLSLLSKIDVIISILIDFFFSNWVFFHDHYRITGLQRKGEGISLTLHYHFHPLHRHLDISRAITAESSPLHIGTSRTRTGNLWFSSANR